MRSDEVLKKFFDERPALEGYVFALTRDYHATQDILQNAAVVVVGKAETYDENRPFRPWATGIVRLEAMSWLRTRDEPVMALDPSTLDECAESITNVFDRGGLDRRQEALAECMQTLSEAGRHVLSLRYAGRRTCEQIATEMKRSTQAVYAMLKRVKSALRDCVTAKVEGAAQ